MGLNLTNMGLNLPTPDSTSKPIHSQLRALTIAQSSELSRGLPSPTAPSSRSQSSGGRAGGLSLGHPFTTKAQGRVEAFDTCHRGEEGRRAASKV